MAGEGEGDGEGEDRVVERGPAFGERGVRRGDAGHRGDTAYLTVKGLRDLTYGLVGLALIAFTSTDAVAWFMLVVALAPLGDTLVVLRHGGSRATAFGIHFATAVVVLLDAALLFAL
ncbi:DUF4267 domain-containing protein [Micromonospora sp. WMMD1076]|uniref:DUF4267 domain-containing protein n=1 Tax=Micromonospora sp. WMMD1076 TaxID=3016103 RepID=UPI002499AD3B|nr:DUF4267 domain-containing protein [Micromonospora sp. WMMD1076]WFF09927.1 DUF4267 domain-containing protein [Micromonospora sp. WMMD1076]